MEPPGDYHADNSRSDLSDILEEEEEELYSDHLREAQDRGYIFRANRVKESVHCIIFGYLQRHHDFCFLDQICFAVLVLLS